MMIKIYKSLDFKQNSKRIEPNDPGVYQVHAEDYESINDLIRRSIRTKSRFVPETSENAVYDDVLDEVNDDLTMTPEKEDRNLPTDDTADNAGSKAERSEAKNPADSAVKEVTADLL